MKQLRVASFGIRGFIGDSFTPDDMINFACAFGTFTEGGTVLLGRDTRGSSPMVHHAVLAGLLSEGCTVLDLGVCPTPMLQFAVPRLGADGAVSISGGHTDQGWNAITLVGRDGAFLDPLGGENVLDFFHASSFNRPTWDGIGTHKIVDDHADAYFDALTAFVDAEAIRAKNYTVIIDPVGGAGCLYLEAFAERMGFRLVPVNARPNAYLARDPEPRPRTAEHLSSIIAHVQADAGFVLSSDMGRLSLVSEIGEPASEEYTFPLIANHVLARTPGLLVTNVCTTRTVSAVAALRNSPVHHTPVGQAFIVSALADEDGVIGGEGSGSVAVPAFSQAFDGFLMMALVLEAMAHQDATLSELLDALPRYHIVKRRVRVHSSKAYRRLEALQAKLREELPGATINWIDGLRLDTPEGWVHARISRTEQAIRILSEATSPELANARADRAVQLLEGGR